MTGKHIVLVTRRFWPLFGGAENTIADLAVGLKDRGAQPTIVTARWDADWSPRAFYNEIPVIRLPKPRGQSWGTLRYLIALARWLRRNRDRIDLVCVSGLRFDAYATLTALRSSAVPVVLRAERAGADGDCAWQRRSRFAARLLRRCRAADAVIASDGATARELVGSGYTADRVCRIANGVSAASWLHKVDRFAARAALADANMDLTVPVDTPVVVYVGRFRRREDLEWLIDAWRAVLSQRPDARLWLIGNGARREELHRRLVHLGVHRAVLMPGTFDDVGDVLTAANVCVVPGSGAGLPRALLEAVAAGIPVVACDTEEIRQCPGITRENARWIPSGDRAALSRAIIDWLTRPPARSVLAEARRRILRHYSVSRMIDEHLRLFEQLITARRGPRRRTSEAGRSN
jgi:glycosyltransferase involved in cell wall biosynthesis